MTDGGWKFKLHVIMHARAHTYLYTKHANVHTPGTHIHTSAHAYTYMDTHMHAHNAHSHPQLHWKPTYLRECGLVKLKQIIQEKNVMHT